MEDSHAWAQMGIVENLAVILFLRTSYMTRCICAIFPTEQVRANTLPRNCSIHVSTEGSVTPRGTHPRRRDGE